MTVKERKALEKALNFQCCDDSAICTTEEPCRLCWKQRLAIKAYGRAVRKADNETAEGREGSPLEGQRGVDLETGLWQPAEYWHGRSAAATAIKALKI